MNRWISGLLIGAVVLMLAAPVTARPDPAKLKELAAKAQAKGLGGKLTEEQKAKLKGQAEKAKGQVKAKYESLTPEQQAEIKAKVEQNAARHEATQEEVAAAAQQIEENWDSMPPEQQQEIIEQAKYYQDRRQAAGEEAAEYFKENYTKEDLANAMLQVQEINNQAKQWVETHPDEVAQMKAKAKEGAQKAKTKWDSIDQTTKDQWKSKAQEGVKKAGQKRYGQ